MSGPNGAGAFRTIRFRLNGRPVEMAVRAFETLADVLRRTGQVGSVRESCGQGLCGTCTVLVDGLAISSCLYLAALADGAEIQTVEGLASGEKLHPLQQAFVDCGAFQCGFCTPGMILTGLQLLRENPDPDEEAIRRYLSGNLCRCGAYPEIVRAIRQAARGGREEGGT